MEIDVRRFAAALVAAVLALAGCDRAPAPPPGAAAADRGAPAAPDQAAALPNILAWVDGDPITQAELDFALARALGDNPPGPVPNLDQIRSRLLTSLIGARAMARQAAAGLSADERRDLDLRVRAYREELLMQRYLAAGTRPQPLPEAAVEAYWRDHPEAFGGGVEKEFELVQTHRALTGEERGRAIATLQGLEGDTDWQARVDGDAELPLTYRRLTANPALLEQPLRGLVEATPAAAVSAIHHGEYLMRVRVLTARDLPPRPLVEVSGEIRRTLAPLQLREAVRAAADAALSKVQVRRADGAPGAATLNSDEPTRATTP